MSWFNLLWVGFTAIYIAVVGMLLLSHHKLISALHDSTEMGWRTMAVIHALAFRLSPQGHVDLSEEELKEGAEGDVAMLRKPGEGVRILAK